MSAGPGQRAGAPQPRQLSPPDSRVSAEARGSVSSLSVLSHSSQGPGHEGPQQKLLVARAPSPDLSVQQDLPDTLPSAGSVDHNPDCPCPVLGHHPRG